MTRRVIFGLLLPRDPRHAPTRPRPTAYTPTRAPHKASPQRVATPLPAAQDRFNVTHFLRPEKFFFPLCVRNFWIRHASSPPTTTRKPAKVRTKSNSSHTLLGLNLCRDATPNGISRAHPCLRGRGFGRDLTSNLGGRGSSSWTVCQAHVVH